jgi:hypothetical protein
MRSFVGSALVCLALTQAQPAQACVTGDACCMALPAGADVADIFRDKLGRTGPQLPVFGKLLNANDVTGCLGVTTDPSTLGAFSCAGDGNPSASHYSDHLDHLWVQHLRTCMDGTSPPDGVGGCFYAPKGLIYDLGAPSNKVVLFPMIDHGPLPQEAFEYSVYLSNNPSAKDTVPRGQNPDPNKWNEATLIKFFERGWNPTDAAPNPNKDVSDDDVTLWGLPCGVNFRYVSLVAGNNGNPDQSCTFYSQEDEIDAVAGLSEDETGVCPDLDMDGHTDKACGGDDCNDNDKAVHPGAPEACDATKDLNCDGTAGGCPPGMGCLDHLCVPPCGVGEFACGATQACVNGYCVGAPCGGGGPCAPGTVCENGACLDPCKGAVCPGGQVCIDGSCVDPCRNIQCPQNQHCAAGLCVPSCACAGCSTPSTCDMTSGYCVDPACASMSCAPGTACRGGSCVDICTEVVCPIGQKCSAGACTPDPCFARDCGPGQACDPMTGKCAGTSDGGVGGGGEGMDAGEPGRGPTSPKGCHCDVGGTGQLPPALLLLLTIGVIALRSRRKVAWTLGRGRGRGQRE